MSIKTHQNWKRFQENYLGYIFFEGQDTLYEVDFPRSFNCKMRKAPIAKVRELLDKMPPIDFDDGDDFYIAWNLIMGDSMPMIEV